MKIAVVADLHFRGKKLQDKIIAWENAVDKMVSLGVRIIYLAGDVFDTRNIGSRDVSMGTVYRAFVQPMSKIHAVSCRAILGNHELATAGQLSALEILKETPIEVADSFGIVDDLDDAIVALIPWISDEDGQRADKLQRWMICIKRAFDLKKNKMKIVVGHLTVRGAALNSGVSIQGSEFEVEPAELDALGADVIALGHLHKRQKYYVGALCQNDFGEEGNPQGFLLIDTDTRTHEFVDIDVPKYTTLKGDQPFSARLPSDNDYVKYRFAAKPENYDELIANPQNTIEIVPERETVLRQVEGVAAGRSDDELLSAYLCGRGRTESDITRIVGVARDLASQLIGGK